MTNIHTSGRVKLVSRISLVGEECVTTLTLKHKRLNKGHILSEEHKVWKKET